MIKVLFLLNAAKSEITFGKVSIFPRMFWNLTLFALNKEYERHINRAIGADEMVRHDYPLERPKNNYIFLSISSIEKHY